jgi:ribonuclease BN (tRNA processing enzyme)
LFGKKGVYRYLNGYVIASESSAYKIRTENIPILNRAVQDIQHASLSLAAIAVHHGPVPALAWRVQVAGCVMVFSGDMSNQYQTLEKLAKGADILIAHNAIPESAQGVARKLHMPPSEIGKIAAKAKVKKLVLSHRMMRTLGREQETLKIIRKSYKGPVKFADDMDVILPESR